MQTNRFVSLDEIARTLNLPAQWLKAEADAGRIPCLRAGRRRLFNLEAVERSLANRAAAPDAGRPNGGVRP